jgi:hypothetical protein
MPATAKKPSVVEGGPADDNPRSALAAAIAAHTASRKAVELKKQTIRRALDGIEAAEKKLERSRADVEKAKEQDVKSAASHFDKADVPDSPWHLRMAISNMETAESALVVADAAHQRLRRDLAGLEDDAAEAANEVLIQVKLLTLPVVQKLLDESSVLKKRLHLNQRLLDLLTDSGRRNDEPTFHDEMRGSRASARRHEVFAAMRAEAQHILFGSHEDILDVLATWKAALAGLRSDAQTKLPEVK